MDTPTRDLIRSHDEMRAALLMAVKRIERLSVGYEYDWMPGLLRRTMKEAKIVRGHFKLPIASYGGKNGDASGIKVVRTPPEGRQ